MNYGNFLTTVSLLAFVPVSLNAGSDFLEYKLPSVIKSIAEGAENDAAAGAAREELQKFSVEMVNSGLNLLEDRLLSTSNFTHLELSLGSDVLGLDEGTKTKTEAMAVYRLSETDNLFLFNQTSVINFDNRNTFNVGFGARFINDEETMIFGANAFYDYEAKSAHKRTGLGLELLTSILELRANKYNAISGTINYNSLEETALDGQDMKLTANLPYFYSSNVYYSSAKWKLGGGLADTKTKEMGFEVEVFPNVTFSISQQKKDSTKAQTVASVGYSIPLGVTSKATSTMQDGSWSTNLRPIREKLYKPVQRENRIMKKTIKLKLTVSGA